MIDNTGTVTAQGRPVGQVQIITNADGERRVQLYNASGVFLCDCPFTGDDDTGFAIGQALYNGYLAGQLKTTMAISARVNRAIYEKSEIMID